ncbi:hypothetical protein HN592_05820 [Candidatus Woesearchaeota archaeon]|jgi:transcription initiation factor IIE alpha subunit|nr:hypothetical protein [Candidatus Woesearchaeota archaeon]MBT3304774.1 hypothetical protein [Candidatus Woesearchaeota archaeon]MBT4367890.1 hypothetical protein [Candidatus Woesearchaeota archaeon]MBT4712378.1 hypothetical protein [Candidatus Woesearchaeota archaeon]MBT6639290.1 hypothetical protein [Candidatus Woesearchaeota archaeon]
MGQQEVYDFLKKHPTKWYTSKEISKALGISIGSITACLKKLRRTETIAFETTGNRNEFRYKFKDETPRRRVAKKPVAKKKPVKKATSKKK